MFNMDTLFDVLATPYGKTAYAVFAGSLGAVILALFFNMLFAATTGVKLFPLIIGFNAACTGYMVIDKTRHVFRCKKSISTGCGIAVALLSYTALNALSLHTAGWLVIPVTDLMLMLAAGAVSGWAGGVLAIKYFHLMH